MELKKDIPKIESAGNIKKEEAKESGSGKQPQNMKQILEPKNSHNKMAPKVISSASSQQKKEEVGQREPKEIREKEVMREREKQSRATSIKKAVKQQAPSKENDWIEEEIEAEERGKGKKVKEDVSAMKRTMRGDNKEEFFAFQEKVSSVLEEQEEVFATHMAAIKEDAKLLTQESELISAIQGIGFMDYDVDSYVDKLESIIKKKMKMYEVLNKKVNNFKKYLSEEDEVRKNVKKVNYY